MILQWYEGIAPFGWQKVIQAREVLPQFDKNRPVLLHRDEGTVGASLVASLEESLPVFIDGLVVLFESDAIA